MAQIFKKPLVENNKIGTTALVNDETPSDTLHSERGTISTGPLIAAMKGSVRTGPGSNSAIAKAPAVPTRPLGRAVRSTRATAPIYDRESIEETEPERYSVIHGLGKRWAK